jgi:hypothetical protein
MKVKIGKYPSWIGPYQLATILCFWAKSKKDEYGVSSKPGWVHSFGEILAHGSIEPKPTIGEVRPFGGRERPKTWLYKLLDKIHEKKKRKVQVEVTRSDVFDLYTTHALILVPMLKKYVEESHGYPVGLDPEDVPEELRGDDERMWKYIVEEMIWAFENVGKDTTDFYTGEFDMVSVFDGKLYSIKQGPNHTADFDQEAWEKFNTRRENGLRLFTKYYFHLWI